MIYPGEFLCAFEKNVCCVAVGWWYILEVSVMSSWFIVSFRSFTSMLIFCWFYPLLKTGY